jgi:Asp-tRNA(Asn)/Glu-tRNA(Gln) amidotransferase A subunit family amidase
VEASVRAAIDVLASLGANLEEVHILRDIFKASMRRLLTDYDLLVAPTVCVPAYPFDAAVDFRLVSR